ncbi:unnamed protein product [Paramecium sonneborni]|uniref:Uncharacterized protein n=1 Tax=Paramecium sonneborni TaxID=65129 RepID=A0A8S1RCE6_9CILI|nr:unnamed protein product [Paramecium sonneborni]
MNQDQSLAQENEDKVQNQKRVNVKLQLKFSSLYGDEQIDNKIQYDAYVYYNNWKENSIKYDRCKMELDQNNIWIAQIDLDPNATYKYYYYVQQKNKIKKESDVRYFKYDQKEKIGIDEWNKVWCLYRYYIKDRQILDFYQIKIKDYSKQSFQSIDNLNEDQTGDSYLECQEILKIQDQQKKRQFAFINKFNQELIEYSNQFDPRKGDTYINNFVIHQFSQNIFLSKEQEGRIEKFISQQGNNLSQNNEKQLKSKIQELENQFNKKLEDLNSYKQQLYKETAKNKESQAKIQNLETRIKDIQAENTNIKNTLLENQRMYMLALQESEYYQQEKSMKQLEQINNEFQQKIEYISKINNEQLKNQKEKMEEESRIFQKKSQEVINKYIEMLEDSNKKLRNYELKNIHYEGDDIKISITQEEVPDEFKQEIYDLETKIQDFQTTETQLKNQIHNAQEDSQKLEKEKNSYKQRAKKIQILSNESKEKLDKCEIELKQAIQKLEIKKQESLQQDQFYNLKISKYQKGLKDLLQKLNEKQDELENFKKAYEEIQKKLELEEEKNIKLQVELESTIKSSEERRIYEYKILMETHNQEIKQIQQEKQQQLLQEKQKFEENQKKNLTNLTHSVIQNVYEKLEIEILQPYFDLQKNFHYNLMNNFGSEIERIINENIDNFETPVNQLQYRLCHIEEEQLQEFLILAQQEHDKLVEAIQNFKKKTTIKNAIYLKECFRQYTIQCNKIDKISKTINFDNDQEGEQIYQLNRWQVILEQKLDSVFRLLNFQQDLQGYNLEFQESRDTYTKALKYFQSQQEQLYE